jgi:hypothetical protein
MIPSLEALLVSCSSLQAQPSRRTQLNFTKLVVLHVSRNDDFVNPIGTSTIPEFLASMKNTRYLDLFGTSILSGEVHIALVEKPSLVGRPKSTIVPVPLKTGTKNDF